MSKRPAKRFSVSLASPNHDWLRRTIIFLAGLGALDALYLVWLKMARMDGWCAGMGDCATVNSSVYSEIFGIPIAVFGLVVYLAVLGISVLEVRKPSEKVWLALVTFGLSLVGAVYSGWLTYVEVVILRAICPFCIASAIIISAILAVSVLRVQKNVESD